MTKEEALKQESQVETNGSALSEDTVQELSKMGLNNDVVYLESNTTIHHPKYQMEVMQPDGRKIRIYPGDLRYFQLALGASIIADLAIALKIIEPKEPYNAVQCHNNKHGYNKRNGRASAYIFTEHPAEDYTNDIDHYRVDDTGLEAAYTPDGIRFTGADLGHYEDLNPDYFVDDPTNLRAIHISNGEHLIGIGGNPDMTLDTGIYAYYEGRGWQRVDYNEQKENN